MLKEAMNILFEKKYAQIVGSYQSGSGVALQLKPDNDEWFIINNIDVSITKAGQFWVYRYNALSTLYETIKQLRWDASTGAIVSWFDAWIVNDENKMVSIGATNLDPALAGWINVNIEYFVVKKRIMAMLLNKLKEIFNIDYRVG
jgi:hypothetical protein